MSTKAEELANECVDSMSKDELLDLAFEAGDELRRLQARVAELDAQLAGQGEPAYWIVEWRLKTDPRVAWRTTRPLKSQKDAEAAKAQLDEYPTEALEHVVVPLFTRPATPLTRQQVFDLVEGTRYSTATTQERADFINGIRWAEKAHGITKGTAS